MTKKNLLIFFTCFVIALIVMSPSAQAQPRMGRTPILRDVALWIDTAHYALSTHGIYFQGVRQLAFPYQNSEAIAELRIYFTHPEAIQQWRLLPSADFQVLDSLMPAPSQDYLTARLRFYDLSEAQFLSLNFWLAYNEGGLREQFFNIRLMPYKIPQVRLRLVKDELYIGEEELMDIEVSDPKILLIENKWTENQPIDYKLSEFQGRVRLHLLANEPGTHVLPVQLVTRRPFIGANGQPTYQLPPIQLTVQARQSRLMFLRLHKNDIMYNEQNGAEQEVEMDYHKNLIMRKTYRIENQEEPGGRLIGEIFTKSKLSTNRVLCDLRLYGLHRQQDGYLYIKDGDKAVYLTNTNIIPRTTVARVTLSRDGAEWTDNLSVQPGESLDLRIEGKSLDKAIFSFDGLSSIRQDSLLRNENLIQFRLKIPPDITRKRITLVMNGQNSGFSLTVREFQRAKPLDFIKIDYGKGYQAITDITSIVLYDKVVQEVSIAFDTDNIDLPDRFFGKQYLEAEVRISSQTNQLLEFRRIENLCACPAENSVRGAAYDRKDCTKGVVLLNSMLSRKTRDLDDWSKIEILFRHRSDRHGGDGYSHKIEIVLQRHYSFDIDVSFPAGLITKKVGEEGFTSLGGISLAIIAQFRFFQPNKVAALRPYRIGVGALALNAFNFNTTNDNRDLGIVVLGSVYPSRRDLKLSFPLFAGFGYLVRETRWFFLVGPGVRIQL
ncbi:MAG: hypothetical protein RMJ87_03340 [Cytophagales bacterium]|nr:hypothetical protein [Bernardetiaceae bacterium]MDW8204042.1 hypothetical protein [Cytophagales bacterium]